jgi:hypothetical protein
MPPHNHNASLALNASITNKNYLRGRDHKIGDEKDDSRKD